MKIKFLIICLALTTVLFSKEVMGFEKNHMRFIDQHLSSLLNKESGKCLLLGHTPVIFQAVCRKYPSIQFEGIPLWYKNSWGNIIENRNWKEYFDAIIAINILEREPNREQIVQVIFNALKPEGKALIYVDSKDDYSYDQKTEQAIRRSEWVNRISFVPALSLSEYQIIIEKIGFQVIDQSPDEYKFYFTDDASAFITVLCFTCYRWPIPRTDWDEELFAGMISGTFRCRHEIIETSNSRNIFNHWIEENFSTHYFLIQK